MKSDAESYLRSGSNELRVLEYRVAGQAFGINILKVNKIINRLTDLMSVPESHSAVQGVIRDMGKVIPVIDLASVLGVPVDDKTNRKVLLTEFFGMQTGFTVDHVDWIHHFQWEDIIDAASVFSGIPQKYVIGIVKPTEEHMILLLDYETILLDLCPNLRCDDAASYQGKADFGGKRLLIAEDSPAVRAMLVGEMTERGFEVVESTDGVQAWEKFQNGSFDLVISDVEMPQMDGLALCLKIRQSDAPDTPVIVYSSIGDMGMKARASFLKADAHVTKLNLEKLINTAEGLMNGERPQMEEENMFDPESEVLETVPLD